MKMHIHNTDGVFSFGMLSLLSWNTVFLHFETQFSCILVPSRRQSNIWINDDLACWCIYVLLGLYHSVLRVTYMQYAQESNNIWLVQVCWMSFGDSGESLAIALTGVNCRMWRYYGDRCACPNCIWCHIWKHDISKCLFNVCLDWGNYCRVSV